MTQSRFFHPYYVLNSLLVIAYCVLRMQRLSGFSLSSQDMFGISRETQIYACLVMMLFSRVLSAPTVDAYLASAFSFARVTVLLCLFYMETPLAVVFLVIWTLIYALCPQPRYRLSDSIVTLTTPSFNERITRNTHRTIYVVWCHAPWSSRCSQLTPVLARLTSLFEHPRIRFARLDVSRFSDTADRLGVSASVTSKQLPCVICFKQGKEVARIPTVDSNGTIPPQWTRGFSVEQVTKQLGLQAHFTTAVKWEQEAQLRYQKKD